MATYREIHGKAIKSLSTDPSNSDDAGQIWYNTASSTFKSIVSTRAYSSATSLPSARGTNAPGGSAQDAGFSVGGNTPPSIANTDEWNGLGWTAGGAYPAGKGYLASAGPQTAALAGGGSAYPDACNTYNGTSWTSITAMPDGYEACRYAGTATVGIMVAGGDGGSPGYPADSHEWGGSSWTAGGALPSPKNYGSTISGTQTAAFSAGGSYPQKNTTSNYDGTSWTVSGNLPTNSYNMMGNSVGSQTAGVTQGGNATSFPAIAPTVYHYDGSVWAADVASPVGYANTGSSFGPQSAHVFAGGNAPGLTALTQEYNISSNTITPAAWASGTALNTARNVIAGAGTQTAGLMIGGNNPGSTQKGETEQYDGTSWTEKTDLNTARSQGGSGGTTSAAVFFGGDTYPASPRDTGATEEWNGSAWSNNPNSMGTARRALIGMGTQTAALAAGGYTTTMLNNVEEYDGSSWTAQNTMPAATETLGGGGTQTAGLTFGGLAPSVTNTTAEYDGTNWTTGGALATARWGLGRGTVGTQDSCLGFGGDTSSPAVTGVTEGYDGTAWSTRPSMGTARRAAGGAGTQTANLCAGGYSTAITNVVEEYTGETTSVNVETLTQS